MYLIRFPFFLADQEKSLSGRKFPFILLKSIELTLLYGAKRKIIEIFS